MGCDVWLPGRGGDVIRSAADRIGPVDVEAARLEHPAVAAGGVVGKPDEDRGEIVKAYVVLRPGFGVADALGRQG